MTIDGERAWQNVSHTAASRWTTAAAWRGFAETAQARITAGVVLPRQHPKFCLREDDVFFCIGSCFARNIEEHLMYRGLHVTSKSIAVRRDEWRARPNGFINKFTAASIANELRWALDEAAFPESALVEDRKGWRDLQLAPGFAASSRDRVLEIRRAVSAYFRGVREATVVIITLGLVETWYDRVAGISLNTAPTFWATRRAPGRFELRVTDYAENLAQLEQIIGLLARHGRSDLRIVLTVSPVPMSETFTGDDVVTANLYSKSTLRAAADDAARKCDRVEYFGSYDAIVTSSRETAYSKADELHVQDGAVEAVTAGFLVTFGIDRTRPHPEFVELEYLFANPDVHDAIVAGAFGSGYEHWLAHGRAEQRVLRSDIGRPSFLEG